MKLYENFQIIWHKVTTIWVFEYFSEFTTGPNTNSTIRAQLFKCRLIPDMENLKMCSEKIQNDCKMCLMVTIRPIHSYFASFF